MNINLQRKIDHVVGIFLCRILSLVSFLFLRSITPKAKPRKFLIILLSEMGSLVLARPMLEHIQKKYPESDIHVMLFEQNKQVVELTNLIPPKRVITIRNQSLFAMMKDSILAIIQLRRLKIDTVIDCELFSRISSIYSLLSGAAIRVGFHPHTQEGLYRGDFINRPVLYNPYYHISQQFITLVDAIESELEPTVKRRITATPLHIPVLEMDKKHLKVFVERLIKDFPVLSQKNLILLYPGGGLLPIRAWPVNYYCDISKDFLTKGYIVGIIGLENDKKLAKTIQSKCSHSSCIDLTGYTKTLRDLMILLQFASMLITNDGGPVHFASLTTTPTITFFGPETPLLYGSLSPNAYHFYIRLSCSPCLTAYNHRNSPCDGNNLCLKNILPNEVLKKAYEILENDA